MFDVLVHIHATGKGNLAKIYLSDIPYGGR